MADETFGNIVLAMRCPHCGTHFRSDIVGIPVPRDSNGYWALECRKCTKCDRSIFHLAGPASGMHNELAFIKGNTVSNTAPRVQVFPRTSGRSACPSSVPPDIASDYSEACLVLIDSPKASAALSRRCLQHVLNAAGGATAKDLSKAIDQVITAGRLPSYIADDLHALRNIGNFAAHPQKDATGQIVDVEKQSGI